MFDELSAACVNIKRADLVEFVRCGEWAIGNVDGVLANCRSLLLTFDLSAVVNIWCETLNII